MKFPENFIHGCKKIHEVFGTYSGLIHYLIATHHVTKFEEPQSERDLLCEGFLEDPRCSSDMQNDPYGAR